MVGYYTLSRIRTLRLSSGQPDASTRTGAMRSDVVHTELAKLLMNYVTHTRCLTNLVSVFQTVLHCTACSGPASETLRIDRYINQTKNSLTTYIWCIFSSGTVIRDRHGGRNVREYFYKSLCVHTLLFPTKCLCKFVKS